MRHRYILFFVLGLCIFLISASAQVSKATVYATVTDSTGAVIPGASVTLNHSATGATITQKTNQIGNAVFDFLPIGRRVMGSESQDVEPAAFPHSARSSPREHVRAENQFSGRPR